MTGSKSLGLWMCTALVVGNMVGSGIFLLPASLASFGGISIFGWLLTSAGSLLVALVFARLSTSLPLAGGPYAYTRKGFGDFAGFLVAWGYWISICCGNAAIATAFVGYLAVFFPSLASPLFSAGAALIAIWILTGVNMLGVRDAGHVQVVTTVLKLIPLVIIGTVGYLFFDSSNLQPFNASGGSAFSAITASAALTLWAFLGMESASIPADSIADPSRTIPRATILGVLIAAVAYIASTFAVMGVVNPVELAGSTAPFADAARMIGGEWAALLVAAGAAIACFGALNGWILLEGQLPLAVARDGLFPRVFAKLSRRDTPAAGMFISSSFVTLLVLTNYTRGLVNLFTFLILLATLNTLFPYIMTTMAALRIDGALPHRGRLGATIIALLAFGYSFWAVAGVGVDAVYWGFLLLMAGVPIYVWLRRDSAASPGEVS